MTLKAYWSFDAGTSADLTGNGHDGTDTHVTYSSNPCIIGKAAQFDGTSHNNIDFPPVVFATGLWTIEGWFEAVSIPPAGEQALIFGNNTHSEGIIWKGNSTPATNMAIALQSGGFTFLHDFLASTGLFVGTKYHWAVVSTGTGGDLLMYLNGMHVNTAFGWGVPVSFNRFGYDGVHDDLNGMVDEVNVYDTAFTDAEVAARFMAGISGGGDANPPTAVVLTAPKGPDDTAVLRVSDDVGLRRVILMAKWQTGASWEVIHDGTGFGPGYQGGANSVVEIAAGRVYDYYVKRQPNWPSGNLPFAVFAIDTSGNEA